jgi:hypothetical protein
MLDLGPLVAAFTTIAATLLGLVAVYQKFGLAALWIAVGLLYLLYLGMQRRSSGYLDACDAFGNGPPRLPPPGKQRLPRPDARQIIGRSNQALTKHRPASPKRSPK